MLGSGVYARICKCSLLSPLATVWALFVESLTCDMLQTGVGQFATGGQVEVLEFDQAGQDWQPRV